MVQCGVPAVIKSIHAGIPQLSDPSQRYSCNIHTHTRGKPADSTGFPPSPSPCTPLLRTNRATATSLEHGVCGKEKRGRAELTRSRSTSSRRLLASVVLSCSLAVSSFNSCLCSSSSRSRTPSRSAIRLLHRHTHGRV